MAPWAENVAHLFGEAMGGKYQPSSPLTRRQSIQASRDVKSRRNKEAVYRDVFTRGPLAPKQAPRKSGDVDLRNCETCGGLSLGDSTSTALPVGRASLVRTFTRVTRGE